ncbi:MAG: trigger factor [Nitrospirae bacterium]|nr:MAG: trigger factor [Nitrospirota bacterium]
MDKKVEQVSPTKKRFTVEVPADVVEERIINSLKKIGRTAKIPGFRPGRAPLSILDKRFGKDVEREVLEELIPEVYSQVVQEEKVSPVAPPRFEDYQFERKSPLRMTFTVEHRPEIEGLNYENLEVTDEEITIEEEEIERILKSFAAERAKFNDVERPAQKDDIVIIDYEIVETGQKTEKQMVQIGNKNVPTPLSEALTGKNKGEEFEAKVDFPEDFQNEDLAGKTVTFKGVVKEIKEVKIPELNDELAKDAGFKDFEELKEKARESLTRAKKQALEEKQKDEIMEELLKRHDFPLPESMVEEELNYLINQEKQQNPDASEDQLAEQLKERAERNVKATILLDVIAEKENITLTEDEIRERIMKVSYEMHMTPEVFMQLYMQDPENYYRFKESLKREKALNLLLERAQRKQDNKDKEEEPKNE